MRLLRASTFLFGVLVPLAMGTAGCGKVVLDLNGSDGGPNGTGSGSDGGPGPTGLAARPAITIGKVDLLLMIDNSASMGDKQAYLEQAVADLVAGLVTPNCVGSDGVTVTGVSSADGTCPGQPSTSQPEFPPVHDLHIGIVSSSLGPRLGDQVSTMDGAAYGACAAAATVAVGGMAVPDHNDDQAHLLERATIAPATAPTTSNLPDAPEGFLDWFPSVTANAGVDAGPGAPQVTSAAVLETDFSDLVAGVQQYGCGIESQLESWYRFLIQPDPYATLALNGRQATWSGVDTTILQERRDFLRPDSGVVIVDLTDENDSEIDVRSVGGQGYYFMSTAFDPPRGTSQCNTNPADPNCISCANAAASKTDPNCAMGAYSSTTDWGFDLNLRHVHTKFKYGIDPQFPISRYVTGLTSETVPDRNGEYPAGAASYVGTNNCDNPLFAGALPDPSTLSSGIGSGTLSSSDEEILCHLPAGTRPANAVFYLHIGGVPHELLTTSTGGTLTMKTTLTASDWVSILGTDPDNFNYTGIDPHMIESQTPRTGQNFPDGTPMDPNGVLAPPTAANNADPVNGREWITNVGTHEDLLVDREYACIFPLTTPRDCTNPDDKLACDCSTTAAENSDTQTISPLCDTQTQTQQDYAKAYPTIRELLLAKKLGAQGIVSSICPIDVTDNAAGDDPFYGYRPAVATLLTRLAPVLAYRAK